MPRNQDVEKLSQHELQQTFDLQTILVSNCIRKWLSFSLESGIKNLGFSFSCTSSISLWLVVRVTGTEPAF